ncbi:MAG: hypothetical protein MZV64_22615, partial [Ignavibacteriales bacterium]|nr:hypothetical protein [Ignavibacteriales bacterium]
MHSGPSADTDVVSQALLGDNVKVLKQEKNAEGEDWVADRDARHLRGLGRRQVPARPGAGCQALRLVGQGLRRLLAAGQHLPRGRRHRAQAAQGGAHRRRPRGRGREERALARDRPALRPPGLRPAGRRRHPRGALDLAAAVRRGHDRPGQALPGPPLHLGRHLPARPRLLRLRPARLQDERRSHPARRRHPDDEERPPRGAQGPGEARRPHLLRPGRRPDQPRRDDDRGRAVHQRHRPRAPRGPHRRPPRSLLAGHLPGRPPPE